LQSTAPPWRAAGAFSAHDPETDVKHGRDRSARIFIVCACGLAFVLGILMAHLKVFPYGQFQVAAKTLGALYDHAAFDGSDYFGEYIEPAGTGTEPPAESRWTVLDETIARLPVLAFGGRNQYLEQCPEQGCVAVAYGTDGGIRRSWPYRPARIFAGDITDGAYPHEFVAFDPLFAARPIGVARYDDGDVLVSFQSSIDSVFPFGLGVARIGADGDIRWTRFDYSHHWPHLMDDGTALVPSMKIGESSLDFDLGAPPDEWDADMPCETGHPHLDTIQRISHSGALLEEIPLIPLFVNSNWLGLLPTTTDFCDPLHLNFIDEIDEDATGDLDPGDLVISLRNISSFAILDRETHEIEQMASGNFLQQHSVQHLSGSKFLIFDNQGGDRFASGSRIIEYDLATGSERRIFPNADTPDAYRGVYSEVAGHIAVSPDKSRILATFSNAGRAFEIELSTGRLLAVFDNVHDLSAADVPEAARPGPARFRLYGMAYLEGE
jgi:hypothetical protein